MRCFIPFDYIAEFYKHKEAKNIKGNIYLPLKSVDAIVLFPHMNQKKIYIYIYILPKILIRKFILFL